MLTEGTRRFDLYDFFSVFIPGATFALGLFPFLPHNPDSFSISLVGVLIVLGLVFGRGIHASALLVEKRFNTTTHRDKFTSELREPKNVDPEVADRFYDACCEYFNLESLPEDRSKLAVNESNEENDTDKNQETAINSLYVLVRSYVHMDARGRSRTFQAVLDFYRSMWIASSYLSLIYVVYASVIIIDGLDQETVQYLSYIGSLGIHPVVIFFGSLTVGGASYTIFRHIRPLYRNYFVQYLMSDFLILSISGAQTEDNSKSEDD
jgi:cytochrome c biogenesis protein CcdA